MHGNFARRDFLRFTGALGAGMGLAGLVTPRLQAETIGQGAPQATKLGWRLGCQAYSFNRFTFFDAIDKTASLGLKVIEAYPGQTISPQHKVGIGLGTPKQVLKAVKKHLADSGLKLVNFGVCGLSRDEGESRKTFDFAKEMGIETVVSEPAEDAFDTLEKLVEEYQINLRVHNHPKGSSRYWNPEAVLKVCQGRSKRIGACADVGHWMRSNLNPTSASRSWRGASSSFHFKDLNKQAGTPTMCPGGPERATCRAC